MRSCRVFLCHRLSAVSALSRSTQRDCDPTRILSNLLPHAQYTIAYNNTDLIL
jgi:hypothetical protein